MDMGVYSLNACRYLTGEDPVHIEGYTSVIDDDGRFRTVEENASWTMKFPSGVIASCSTTYGANMPGFYRVYGSTGILHAEPAFSYEGIQLKAQLEGGQAVDDQEAGKDPSQFVAEADDFAACILENRQPKANGEEGLKDMKFMDSIYKSAGGKLG